MNTRKWRVLIALIALAVILISVADAYFILSFIFPLATYLPIFVSLYLVGSPIAYYVGIKTYQMERLLGVLKEFGEEK